MKVASQEGPRSHRSIQIVPGAGPSGPQGSIAVHWDPSTAAGSPAN